MLDKRSLTMRQLYGIVTFDLKVRQEHSSFSLTHVSRLLPGLSVLKNKFLKTLPFSLDLHLPSQSATPALRNVTTRVQWVTVTSGERFRAVFCTLSFRFRFRLDSQALEARGPEVLRSCGR